MVEQIELIPKNKEMNRREEPTNAPTPDKFDRSARVDSDNQTKHKGPRREGKNIVGDDSPYPLTEEEATPNTPRSEARDEHRVDGKSTERRSRIMTTPTRKRKERKTIHDYNRYVTHARRR